MIDAKNLKNFLNNTPHTFVEIARKFYIPREDSRKLGDFLQQEVKDGNLFLDKERRYFVPDFKGEAKGILSINVKGFGFLDIDEEKSIFIPRDNMGNAFNNDEVRVKYFEEQDREGYQGFVVEIIKRDKNFIVGEIVRNGRFLDIVPVDKRIKSRLRLEDESLVEEGCVYKLAISKTEKNIIHFLPINKLGLAKSAFMDIDALIVDSNVRNNWDALIKKEIQTIPSVIDNEDKENRKDLREKLIVTIDGDDTKDFDDAIEVKLLENGNFHLGVHIADVTHYVKEGSAIDDEALSRGTSIYLADRVIPMLPEELSNGICSLNPNVDRFVISCEIEIDKNGNTVKYDIFPSIINSKHRLTYNEVNDFYSNKKTFDDELSKMLKDMLSLSLVLREKKNNDGYIDFEIEEAKIILDSEGVVEKIIPRPRAESEILIEDFMVRANETIAEHAVKMEVPFVYRVHDKPEMERVQKLQDVVKTLGLNVRIPQNPDPKKFAEAINELKTQRFDDFIKITMLRTMAKAEYSKNNIGHFGLASKFYTHFTSPIRRYPDLMVHRMLREYFFNGNLDKKVHFNTILDSIALKNSNSEIKAVQLERKVADMKKAEYYQSFVGSQKKGQIVSITKFGFFVEFEDKVNGLVHVSSLFDGKYKLVPPGLKLTNDKRTFCIGDSVDVVIVSTDKSEGKIDLVILDQHEEYKKYKNRPPRPFYKKRR